MSCNIIYSDGDNICVVSGADGVSLVDVINCSVPSGRPYIIVDRAALPISEFPPELWEVDLSIPDGLGGSHE